MQGLPEGHTEACYPVLRPGVDSHRGPPLKDSDADKREVCQHSTPPPACQTLTIVAFCDTLIVMVAVILTRSWDGI